MNALHQLMAENSDPDVVQTCAQCLQALAKVQSKALAAHADQQGAVQQVQQLLGGQQ